MIDRACARPIDDPRVRLHDAESTARHANNRKAWVAVRDTFPRPYTIDDGQKFIRGAIAEESATRFCIEINGTAVVGELRVCWSQAIGLALGNQ